MKLLFQMILTAFFMFVIGWFVSFQYNPYNVCRDHPDIELRKDFYECEPGLFTLQKGTKLERSPEEMFPWEKHGDTIIGTNSKPEKRVKNKIKEDYENNQKYKCRPEFYKIDPKDFGKINIDDYCEDSSKPKQEEIKIDNLDETSQEL